MALSPDGLKVACGTGNGSIGLLSIDTHKYTYLMRGHPSTIVEFELDPRQREFATVGRDRSARVWDLDSFEQLYQFDSPDDMPRCICYHPTAYLLACGYDSGYIRIFGRPESARGRR